MSLPAVSVRDLRVELFAGGHDVVDGISFDVAAGEVLGLVGESGSGKTTVGLALLGLARRGMRIAGGAVHVGGDPVLGQSEHVLRRIRGKKVSYVPQDPGTALNPAMRIGHQLTEILDAHNYGSSRSDRRKRLTEMLEEVLLPSDSSFLKRYPHQLSGGQQQRVALAMAFACRPSAIVLDEPTTGLDVTTQAHVLRTVRDLCRAHGVAALYVSHDLAVVATVASRVAVMYAGRLVEIGPEHIALDTPAHPYTRGLVEAIPRLSGNHTFRGTAGSAARPGHRPAGCAFAPRCPLAVDECGVHSPPAVEVGDHHQVRCFRHGEATSRVRLVEAPAGRERRGEDSGLLLEVRELSASYGDTVVVHGASLRVKVRQCVALVGESGSGKTTLARCIGGIHSEFAGEIRLRGTPMPAGARNRSPDVRRDVQYVFQNPYASLSPRKTIGQTLQQPLRLFFALSRREQHERMLAVLERVALSGSLLARYPRELSGGERQRVAIARALLCEPRLLICDEITSALDVSVQAAIVNLIGDLQEDMGLGILFVTHNLALIREMAEEAAVMSKGRIIESGPVETVLGSPEQEYTRRLLADTPDLDEALHAARTNAGITVPFDSSSSEGV